MWQREYHIILHRLRATTALASVTALLVTQEAAYALPTGGQVVGGQASIASNNKTLNVNQSSNRAILNWTGFDIGSDEQVNFNQPSAQSVTLNRVVGSQNPSQILGQLNANGTVMIVNPQGVFFGQGSQVNVGSLLATTSDIGNANFMAGNYLFDTPGSPTASISNAGAIHIADSGLAALVGPNVSNSGLINARLGKAQLASGDSFTLDLYGDGLINLQASPGLTQQLVENSGTIAAAGGKVLLTTATAQNTVNSLVNMDGLIQANSVGEQNGQIVLYAEGSNAVAGNNAATKGQKSGGSTVLVSGTLDASGTNPGETGGSISVLGDHVGILSTATIDASGASGGGNIKIGGALHGHGDTPTAIATVVQEGALIKANALNQGDGGNVAVWSDYFTDYAGAIEAKGGINGGNGGFVETSGKINLQMHGSVDASASGGIAGTWLMDPEDVTISTGADSDITGNPSFIPNNNQATATLHTSDITTALNAGTNVSVTTGGDAQSGPNGGSITLSNNLTVNSSSNNNATLTLSSYKDLLINANITAPTTGSGKLNVVLDSDNQGNHSGTILFSYGTSITSNGGNITFGGGALSGGLPSGNAWNDAASAYGIYLSNTTIHAKGGNIVMNGGGSDGIYTNYGSMDTTGSGNITLNGTGNTFGFQFQNYTFSVVDGILSATGTGTAGGTGMYLAGNTLQATGTGTVTLQGSGASSMDIYGSDTITSASGPINLIAPSGSIVTYTNNAIGGASTSGTITLTTNAWSLVNTSTIQTSGNLIILPYSANTTVGVGTGAGTLSITDTELGYMNLGGVSSLTIGGTTAGAMAIKSGFTFSQPTSFITGSAGSAITVSNSLSSTNGLLLLSAAGNITINNGVTVSDTGTPTGTIPVTLALRADNAGTDSNYGVVNSGTINMSGATGAVSIFYDSGGTYTAGTQTANGSWAAPSNQSVSSQFTAYKLINSVADLAAMSLSGTYALGENITGSGAFNSNVPLGALTGKLDGQYCALAGGATCALTGLTMTISDSTTLNTGLFSSISSGGIVRNLELGMTVSDTYSGTSTANVGSMVGTNSGTIANVTTTNTDTVTGVNNVTGTNANTFEVGGLVGNNSGASGIITGSSSSENVTYNYNNSTSSGTSTAYVGGLVGYNPSTAGTSIGTSSASGTVTAQYGGGGSGLVIGIVGGLIGENGAGGATATSGNSATGSVTSSLIDGNNIEYIGGLAGYNDSSSTSAIVNSYYTTGTVSYTGAATTGIIDMGGLVGYNLAGTITGTAGSPNTYSYSTGTVSYSGTATPTAFYIGGLVGQNGNVTAVPITYAYATGPVSYSGSAGSAAVGGLVGYNSGGAISHIDTAPGSVSATSATNASSIYVGGLVGSNTGTITSVSTTSPSTVTGNSTVTGTNTNTFEVGGLVGNNSGASGIITGSSSSENVTYNYNNSTSSGTSTAYVGGLVGYNLGTAGTSIGTSSASGTVTAQYGGGSGLVTGYIGGLIGQNGNNTLVATSGNSATGSVTSSLIGGNEYIGGLVGYDYSTSASAIVNSYYTTGTVSYTGAATTSNIALGGLVGYNLAGTITGTAGSPNVYSYSTGTVSYSGTATPAIFYIGGLVGSTAGNITYAYATGPVSYSGSAASADVGGLAGYNSGAISHIDTAPGSVSATSAANGSTIYEGGLVGANSSGTITSISTTSPSTVTGNSTVTGTNTNTFYVGGLVG